MSTIPLLVALVRDLHLQNVSVHHLKPVFSLTEAIVQYVDCESSECNGVFLNWPMFISSDSRCPHRKQDVISFDMCMQTRFARATIIFLHFHEKSLSFGNLDGPSERSSSS